MSIGGDIQRKTAAYRQPGAGSGWRHNAKRIDAQWRFQSGKFLPRGQQHAIETRLKPRCGAFLGRLFLGRMRGKGGRHIQYRPTQRNRPLPTDALSRRARFTGKARLAQTAINQFDTLG